MDVEAIKGMGEHQNILEQVRQGVPAALLAFNCLS
jgi:hypothetical protein